MPRTKKAAIKKPIPKPEMPKVETAPAPEKEIIKEHGDAFEFPIEIPEKSKGIKYFNGIGRRKTAVANVRLFPSGEKTFLVNEKTCKEYFPTSDLQQIVASAFVKMKCEDRFGVVAKVHGGGVHAQAEAVRHGISRAMVKFNDEFKKRLSKVGYLTRDPRMRERKKFGLKRARRAPQWGKR